MTDEFRKDRDDGGTLAANSTGVMDRSTSNSDTLEREDTNNTIRRLGKLKLRGKTDDLPQYVMDYFPPTASGLKQPSLIYYNL
jgi:hypothetical protein